MFTKQIYRFRNESHTMKEWAEKSGISIQVLSHRWKKGLRGKALLEKPIPNKIPVSYNIFVEYKLEAKAKPETHTLKEWAEITGISKESLALRYANGDRDEVLFRRKSFHKQR